MSDCPEPKKPLDRRTAFLVMAFLAGPAAWLASHVMNTILLRSAERSGSKAAFFWVMAGAVVVVLGGAAVGLRVLRSTKEIASTDSTGASRERFLAVASLVACGFFLFVLAGSLVPALLHEVTER